MRSRSQQSAAEALQCYIAKVLTIGRHAKEGRAMIAAVMDEAEVAEGIAVAEDEGDPGRVAEGEIAAAAALDAIGVNYQRRNTLRIGHTSLSNSKDLRSRLSQFCYPASRCQY